MYGSFFTGADACAGFLRRDFDIEDPIHAANNLVFSITSADLESLVTPSMEDTIKQTLGILVLGLVAIKLAKLAIKHFVQYEQCMRQP